jgi:hypothetical protein
MAECAVEFIDRDLSQALAYALAAFEHAPDERAATAARAIETMVRIARAAEDIRRRDHSHAERPGLQELIRRFADLTADSRGRYAVSAAIRIAAPWSAVPERFRRDAEKWIAPRCALTPYGLRLRSPRDVSSLLFLAMDMRLPDERVRAAALLYVTEAAKLTPNFDCIDEALVVLNGGERFFEDQIGHAVSIANSNAAALAKNTSKWDEARWTKETDKVEAKLYHLIAESLPEAYAVALEHEAFAIKHRLPLMLHSDKPLRRRVSDPALDYLVAGIVTSETTTNALVAKAA